jgi:hypothetical protein
VRLAVIADSATELRQVSSRITTGTGSRSLAGLLNVIVSDEFRGTSLGFRVIREGNGCEGSGCNSGIRAGGASFGWVASDRLLSNISVGVRNSMSSAGSVRFSTP